MKMPQFQPVMMKAGQMMKKQKETFHEFQKITLPYGILMDSLFENFFNDMFPF